MKIICTVSSANSSCSFALFFLVATNLLFCLAENHSFYPLLPHIFFMFLYFLSSTSSNPVLILSHSYLPIPSFYPFLKHHLCSPRSHIILFSSHLLHSSISFHFYLLLTLLLTLHPPTSRPLRPTLQNLGGGTGGGQRNEGRTEGTSGAAGPPEEQSDEINIQDSFSPKPWICSMAAAMQGHGCCHVIYGTAVCVCVCTSQHQQRGPLLVVEGVLSFHGFCGYCASACCPSNVVANWPKGHAPCPPHPLPDFCFNFPSPTLHPFLFPFCFHLISLKFPIFSYFAFPPFFPDLLSSIHSIITFSFCLSLGIYLIFFSFHLLSFSLIYLSLTSLSSFLPSSTISFLSYLHPPFFFHCPAGRLSFNLHLPKSISHPFISHFSLLFPSLPSLFHSVFIWTTWFLF